MSFREHHRDFVCEECGAVVCGEFLHEHSCKPNSQETLDSSEPAEDRGIIDCNECEDNESCTIAKIKGQGVECPLGERKPAEGDAWLKTAPDILPTDLSSAYCMGAFAQFSEPTVDRECREAMWSEGRACRKCPVDKCYRKGWKKKQVDADNKRLNEAR